MEAIGYILIYLLRGSLPWEDIEEEDPTSLFTKQQRIQKMKSAMLQHALCEPYPIEFQQYFDYISWRVLFAEAPNYDYLRKLFRDLYVRSGYADDDVFDWDSVPAIHSSELVSESAPAASACPSS